MKAKNRILLVLGGALDPVDQLASRDTLLRCGQAVRAWHRGECDYLLVTGGIRWGPEIQTRPLGDLMQEFLIRQGVPAERILVENKALDTFQNIEFSLQLLRERGWQHARIVLVSQWQHVLRAMITMLAFFVWPAWPIFMNYRLSSAEFRREFLYILYHCLDPRGRLPLARRNRAARQMAATKTLQEKSHE